MSEERPSATPGAVSAEGRAHEHEHRHPHRRRNEVIAVAIVVALLLGGLLFARELLRRGKARQVTVEEALRDFRARGDGEARGRPAEGVYEYRGSGTERLNKPPLSQSQGPEIPVTVTWSGDDCWELHVDYSSNHSETDTFCREGDGTLVEPKSVTEAKWVIAVTAITTTSTTTCDPPEVQVPADATAGWTDTSDCTQETTATSGETTQKQDTTLVGLETVHVGGTDLRALHFREETEFSGAQDGTSESDWWLAADTGLPLRNRRTIRISSPSPIGDVTYTEQGDYQIASLTPRR